MQNRRTHFEQVPLAAIRKIVDEEIAKRAVNRAGDAPPRITAERDLVPAAGNSRPEQRDAATGAFLTNRTERNAHA